VENKKDPTRSQKCGHFQLDGAQYKKKYEIEDGVLFHSRSLLGKGQVV
jgi:hypothetical protein